MDEVPYMERFRDLGRACRSPKRPAPPRFFGFYRTLNNHPAPEGKGSRSCRSEAPTGVQSAAVTTRPTAAVGFNQESCLGPFGCKALRMQA